MSTAESSVMAVDVGGTGIKAALIDSSGTTVRSGERPTPVSDGPDAVVEAVRSAAREIADSSVVAAGVVVPGDVDVVSGTARYAANIGWRDVPLRDLLAADLGVPVALEHDVRAAGVAERTLGRTRGVADCLLVVIGTGIAGVIVSAGAALRGATDLAGEIGHIPVHPDGETCACGQRGCLETYASAAAIARRYRLASGDGAVSGRDGTVSARDGAVSARDGAVSARDVAAARVTDTAAAAVWRDATEALGIALASYTLLLDPTLIVLGGGLAVAGAALVEPVRAELAARLSWRAAPAVELSALGSRAGLLGAAILAWQAVGRPDVTSAT